MKKNMTRTNEPPRKYRTVSMKSRIEQALNLKRSHDNSQ
jgi:hypothetical protein